MDRVQLRSAIPGRQRWEVDILRDQPEVAGLIESSLGRQPEINEVVANPLTGRILVKYDDGLSDASVARLVGEAVAAAKTAIPDLSSTSRIIRQSAPRRRGLVQTLLLGAGGMLGARLLMGGALFSAPVLTGAAVVATAAMGWNLWQKRVAAKTPTGRPHPLLRLKPFLKRRKAKIIRAVIFSVLHKILDIAPPLLIGASVDVITSGQSVLLAGLGITASVTTQLLIIGGATALVFILESLLEYAAKVQWGTLAQEIQHDIRLEAWSHVQSLELAYFEEQTAGRLSVILNDDVNELEHFFDGVVHTLIQQAANLVVVGLIFFIIAPSITWVVLLPIPVILWASSYFHERVAELYLDIREKVAGLSSQLVTNISGVATIKSFTAEDYEIKRIQQKSDAYLEGNLRAITLTSSFTPWIRMAVLFGFAGTIVLGGLRVMSGALGAGPYSLLVFLTQRMLWPLTTLGDTLEAYQRAMASATRVLDLLDEPVGATSGHLPLVCSYVQGDIRLESVNFEYEPGQMVLRNLSFEIPARQTTAIVGATGSGKTTIVKLLLRFYEVSSGRITLDDRDLRSLKVRDLRTCIGLVSQDGFLFDGTIRDNIVYGSFDADPASIVEAAVLAEAHDFIQALPNQYETMVGERGVKLSGGQRQRICIARAILKNPPILILDEATSAVDYETEAAIQQSLERISVGRTIIIIAHRLSTVRNAERIYVLDKNGTIIEQGRHQELLRRKGFYEWLWRVQTGAAAKGSKNPLDQNSGKENNSPTGS